VSEETTEYYKAMKEKRNETQQDRLEYAKTELDKKPASAVEETHLGDLPF